MTDVLHIHGRDQKGKPSYTKTKVGEPVIEVTEAEVKTMEQWANERTALQTDAMTPNPDPMDSLLAGFTAPDKDAS